MTSELTWGLERLAQRLHGERAAVAGITRLSSGANLETYAFNVHAPDASREYILRRRTGVSGTFSIGIAAEASLLNAVSRQGVLAPPLIHLCEASDGLGEAHVTARVAGETLGRKIVGDERFAAVRPKLARQCGEQLARIHSTPPPIELEFVDAEAVLARYEEVYRQSGAERPVFELSFRHLQAMAPVARRGVVLHGDFRNGNLIVDRERGLAAVLDWELAHRGDAAEDLGWLCANSWRFGEPTKPVGGFGVYEDLLAGYTAAGGEEIPLARVRYWQAVGSLKWGVMCLMMYESWAQGTAKSVERPVIGRRVSETEIDLLNLFEAGL